MLIGLEEQEANWGSTSSPNVFFFSLEQGQHKQEAPDKKLLPVCRGGGESWGRVGVKILNTESERLRAQGPTAPKSRRCSLQRCLKNASAMPPPIRRPPNGGDRARSAGISMHHQPGGPKDPSRDSMRCTQTQCVGFA